MEDFPKHAAETSETPPASAETAAEDPIDDAGETTMEALLSEQAEVSTQLQKREVTRVRVVQVLEDRVLVDIGEKVEGIVPRSDFADGSLPSADQRIPVVLERRGRGESPAQLSFRKARQQMGWNTLRKAFESGERQRGRVRQWIKGGYRVDIDGVDAFMPISQSELRTPPRHRLPVGARVRFYILELQDDRRQAVVSRRKVLEEDEKKRRGELMTKIKPGQTHRGWISHINEHGVFVNLGGVEGLVRTEDVDWKDPEKAKAAVKRGSRISVKVLSVDEKEGKVALGIKQLRANPADQLKRRFPPKSTVKAKILSVAEEGAAAQVGSVPAWISAENFAEDELPKEGEVVKALVLGVRYKAFDLNLSIRRFEDIEDRKRMKQYLRKAPPLTLGQVLSASEE